MRRARTITALGASLALGLVSSLVVAVVATAPATAAGSGGIRFAPAGSATIHPGVQTVTKGGQCTANFVFRDKRHNLYVGQAAHCSGLGGSTQTNGCRAKSLPLGTRVTFNEGGSLLSNGRTVGRGRLAYSSWVTMNRINTSNANACAFNDFALVKVAKSDRRKVNPSVPFWGGPSGIDRSGTHTGDRVYSYGNSGLRAGLTALSPKTGISLGDAASDGGWSHPLYTLTPGVPGDSGSAFMSAGGKAVGVLSTLGLAPLPLSNNIADLAKSLRFAKRHSGIKGLRLVRGTERFDPAL